MNCKPLLRLVVGLLATAGSAQSASWTPTGAPAENWISVASSADGRKLVAAAAHIYTSTDAGESWTMTSAPVDNWWSVASSSDGSKLVAAAGYFTSGSIYTSTDSGATWSPTSAPYTNWTAVVSSADGNKLAAVVFGGLIHTSADAGVTWIPCSVPQTNWICISSSADGTKLAAGVGFVGPNPSPAYISTNSGASWVPTPPPYRDWAALASSADGRKVVASAGNGIYTSTNYGFNWTSMPGAIGDQVACSADGTIIMASEFVGLISISTDSGNSWMLTDAPNKNWISIASSTDGSRFIAAVNVGQIYSWPSMPRLTISQAEANINVQWPSNSGSAGFVLQQSFALGNPNWSNVTATVNSDGTNNSVHLPGSMTNHFFRLQK